MRQQIAGIDQATAQLRDSNELSWGDVCEASSALGLPAPDRRALRMICRGIEGEMYSTSQVRDALAKLAGQRGQTRVV